MANEYLIPVGFDFKGQSDLRQAIEVLESVEAKGGEVGKTMTEEFGKGAKAVEEFDKKVKPIVKNIEAVRDASKVAGKEVSEAFNDDKVSSFEKTIERFKENMTKITANVDIDIPDDKLRIYEAELAKAQDGVDELRVAMLIMADVAQGLDVNSDEYKALEASMNEVEVALNEYGGSVEEVMNKSQNFKKELKDLKQDMANLENAGKANTQEFREMAIRAGELEDQIGDTSAQIRILASDTKNIDGLIDGVTGLVGAFTLAQGAVGLFAEDNEDLQKALLKVNSAMAILQGLQAVSNTLNKDSAFSVVYLSQAKRAYAGYTLAVGSALGIEASATGTATLATKAFSLALASIGIGLIIIAIVALVEYWDDLTKAVNDFLPAGASVGKTFDKIKSYALGVGNAIVQYLIAPVKIAIALLTDGLGSAIDQAKKSYNAVANFQEGLNNQTARNNQKYRDEQEKKNIDFARRELERRKNRGEDTFKLEQRLRAREMAFNKRLGNDNTAIRKEYEDAEDKGIADSNKKKADASKKANDDAKKRAEEARKNQEEARKKGIEDAKKANDQIKKFTEELEDAKIRNIKDSSKREREALEDGFDDKINALKDEVALTKKAKEQQAEIILELEKEKTDKLKEFDEKVAKEKLQVQLDANKELQNLSKDSLDKELQLLAISAKETENAIREKYKDEEKFKTELLEASEKNRAEKQKEIVEKYAKQALKDEEERALLNIDLMSTYAEKSEETELQKQIAIQQVKLDFAEQNLKLLLDSGGTENDLEVLRAKKIVADTTDALNEAVTKNNNKPFDLMSFLGIGEGLSGEQKDSMKKAFNSIGQSLGELTDFMVQQYDRQIEKKQEAIDQIDNEIGDLEDRLDDEKKLKEDGFANDVELIEAEIAEKQRQKDEEIRQQQEFLEKKKQMQRLQMVADTAVQLVNMITASTEIFKSLSSIPFIGIPLAISTIGLMFGAFATAKISALQSISDTPKQFRKGGRIGGKSHDQGGNKFYSADGTGIEHERGEHIFSVDDVKKYGNLFNAITDKNFNGLSMSDAGVVELFKNLGFQTDISGMRKQGQEFQLSLMSIGYSGKDQESFKEVNDNLKELIRLQKETPTSYSDGVFNYLREGNKVKKTRLISAQQEPKETIEQDAK